MKRIFEYRVYDILKDDDNREFLDKVKDENPDMYGRFVSLVGNKGLEVAKQRYLKHDPVEINRVKKEKKKETREQQKWTRLEQKHNFIMSNYGDAIKKISDHLDTSPLKKILPIIKQEKNLRKWKKQYKSSNLKIGNQITSFSASKPIDTVVLSPRIYKNRNTIEFQEDSITIYQYVDLLRGGNSIKKFYFSIIFAFDIDFVDDFNMARNLKLDSLRTLNTDYDGLMEVIEKFKYYMSDKYREDWEVEKESEKYNL